VAATRECAAERDTISGVKNESSDEILTPKSEQQEIHWPTGTDSQGYNSNGHLAGHNSGEVWVKKSVYQNIGTLCCYAGQARTIFSERFRSLLK